MTTQGIMQARQVLLPPGVKAVYIRNCNWRQVWNLHKLSDLFWRARPLSHTHTHKLYQARPILEAAPAI